MWSVFFTKKKVVVQKQLKVLSAELQLKSLGGKLSEVNCALEFYFFILS